MFDHLGINVTQFDKAVRFYQAALEPLGYVMESHDPAAGSAGFGKKGAPQLWLGKGQTKGLHVAFVAKDRKAVQAFHAAALELGGKDNGKPGLRKDYGAGYYAAFVLDPDGNNVEAVVHEGER